MPDNRKSTKYNQIVGVLKTGCVFVLDETFEYVGGTTKGAIRYEMEILTKQDVEYQNDPEYLEDFYEDQWQYEVAHNMTKLGLEEWAKEKIANLNNTDLYSFSDDPSFRKEMSEAYDKLTEEQKATLDKAVGKDENFIDWNCYCCGRCGDKISEDDFAVILNPELLEVIKKAES